MKLGTQILNLLVIMSTIFAQFDWQDNGIPVRQGIHIEWQRTGDVGADGEMIFAWSDTRFGGRDIYIQKVDINGNNLWGSEGTAVVLAPGRQEDPILVSDGAGGAFVIWVDYRDEPEHGDIYGQHVLSDGSVAWGIEGIVLTNVEGKQVSPNMCSDGQGGAFVIWKDKTVSTVGHIYGTHLTSDVNDIIEAGVGVPLLSNDSDHTGVSIEVAGSGHAVMVWTDDRTIDDLNIYGQRIDSDMNTLWSTPEEGGIVICDASNNQEYAKVTYVSENTTVAVWEDKRNNEEAGDIYAQLLDINGIFQFEDNGLEICTNDAPQLKPRVKADAYGSYIVWEDARNGNSDIYSQKLLSSGVAWEDDGRVISQAFSTQDQPRLTTDGQGGVYYVWMDERFAPYPNTEIYMQHIDADGNVSFEADGQAICIADHKQFNPLVRNDGNGGAIAIWGDMRTGSIGMFAQHLHPQIGISLVEDGVELYFGIDGHAVSPKSLYMGNDNNLIYWEDNRLWDEDPDGYGLDQKILSYGQKVNSGYEQITEDNGIKLCDNPYQSDPKAEVLGENILLGFGYAFGDIVQYYQLLDENLFMQGGSEGTPVFESWTNQSSFELVHGDDGFVYYIFSDQRNYIDYDIYVQKFDSDGSPQWAEPALVASNFFIDDNVKTVEALPGGGCIITYNTESGGESSVMTIAMDSDGSILESWGSGVNLTDEDSDQFIEGSAITEDGIFVIWKDQRSGWADIYGQYINFSGELIGNTNGIPIAVDVNDQTSATITYNETTNEMLVCWEDFRSGADYDIYCKTVNISTLEVGEDIIISNDVGNQKTPNAFTSVDGTYMIAWEDSRLGIAFDIFYQEISNNSYAFENGGIVVCDADFNQFNPKIDLYSETDNSYMIYWDDMRSSGKEDLKNIYIQSVTLGGACTAMDVNGDGIINVLDIVLVVNIVLDNTDPTLEEACAADVNGDGVINVLDIVSIVNYIIS